MNHSIIITITIVRQQAKIKVQLVKGKKSRLKRLYNENKFKKIRKEERFKEEMDKIHKNSSKISDVNHFFSSQYSNH